MARDVMILMRAIPYQGSLEGVCPENRDFLGPLCFEFDVHEFCCSCVGIGTGKVGGNSGTK